MKGNNDQYTGIGKIWEIAARHNQQSLIQNGAYTVRRVRKVKETKQLPLN